MSPTVVEDLRSTSEAEGLAAGLRLLLAGGVPAPCSSRGLTLVPTGVDGSIVGWTLPGAWLPAEDAVVTVLSHELIATEGLALVEVSNWDRARPGDPPSADRTGLLLAAVRLGLTEHMLDVAVRHLGGRQADGKPLTDKQLLRGAIADVLVELETCRYGLRSSADHPAVAAELHARLDTAARSIRTFFGAEGYLRDHPVRCLYFAELVHTTWTGIPDATRY
ncbi:hypothetical protein DMC61_21925 [Amycolatopsis sp. WAC 04169]|nr:hypothetical protein DMC61_21925 [Amycolatopsis sp. WAC 04169]